MNLPLTIFKTIIEYTPLVSIDLILKNTKGEVLLGYRSNRPAQGFWFVPGGRIKKDESMNNAFRRISYNEIGIELDISQADFVGPYEHFYTDNVTCADFSSHYIVLGYSVCVGEAILSLPKIQHSEYKWMSVDELRSDHEVHKNSRFYFDELA